MFVHGIGDSWRSFELVFRSLPETVHAFALTQRGHGDAGRPSGGYCVTDFATDLAGFMDAIGLKGAVIVGGSSGGLVARRYAIDHPERVLGLVMLGSPASLRDRPGMAELWESTISKLSDPVEPAFVRGLTGSTLARPIPQEFFEAMVKESLKVPAFVWKATFQGLIAYDDLEEIGRINAPTLIIWGDRDAIVARSEQDRLLSAIPGSRLLVYDGAGHLLYWEEPGRVASDLASFVGRIRT